MRYYPLVRRLKPNSHRPQRTLNGAPCAAAYLSRNQTGRNTARHVQKKHAGAKKQSGSETEGRKRTHIGRQKSILSRFHSDNNAGF